MAADSTPLPDFITLKNESGTSDDMCYLVGLEYLPNEFHAIAQKDLNETEENKIKGLKKLREYLKREKMPDLEDHFLTAVLRCSKYNRKKSETKLKKFLKARKTIFEKITELDLKKVELILEDKGIGVLPYRDKHGRAIIFTRADAMNDDLYSMDDLMLTAVALAMTLLTFPLTSVGGLVYIGDSKYKSVSSYFALLKAFHQYMWTFLDMPLRLGRVDVINEHSFVRWFVGAIRPFMSSKIVNRLYFFGSNLDNLQKEYHPGMLPEEFGGKMGPLSTSSYKDKAMDLFRQLQAQSRALKETLQ